MDYREQELKRERRNAEFWREEKEARFAVGCPECGSVDGMVDLYPSNILAMTADELAATPLYRINQADFEPRFPDAYQTISKLDPNDVYALFATCPVCNASGIVDDGYVPVTADQAVAWARHWQEHGGPPPREFWK